MRLPADAVLLIIDAEDAIGGPRRGGGDAPEAERAIVALVAAWRAEALTLVHVGRRSAAPASSQALPPLEGEIVIARDGASAFAGTALEAGLDELGATTLVLCGELKTPALEATAWRAGDLGYQVFIVADACRARDAVDLNGRLWPAEDVRALALARLKGETATIVDVGTALRAAATAKARQRRGAGRV
jgi:nicotinamidase-related amidase